ncbi:MAG: glycosyltransferase, partial [Bacteroidota bacterium]
KKVVLAIGGSLGARTINESLLVTYKVLLEKDIQLIWQTGKFYFNAIEKQLQSDKVEGLWINAFISKMDYAYACADVVVSRAGALSISELCLAAKPSLLIPSPNVAEDHQTKNALALVKEEAALMLPDAQAKENLQEKILTLIENDNHRAEMAKNVKALAKPDAAHDIAKEIVKLAS